MLGFLFETVKHMNSMSSLQNFHDARVGEGHDGGPACVHSSTDSGGSEGSG